MRDLLTTEQLPTEFVLADRLATPTQVEWACTQTTAAANAVALAVGPANVKQAASLLFGTNLGVVSALDNAEPTALIAQARLSVATGANEISLPSIALDEPTTIRNLKSFLGATTPLTIDVTAVSGAACLDEAEHALKLGVSYVSYAPDPGFPDAAPHTADLCALVRDLGLGGVKISTANQPHVPRSTNTSWALPPAHVRLFVPLTA